jgi:competence protein ComEA
VKKPGIYQLVIGQRLADLLTLAGGFAKDADQAYVAKTLNLATELNDQDKIYIPFATDNQTPVPNPSAKSATAANTSNLTTAPADAKSNGGSAGNSNAANTSGSVVTTGLISINQADSASLQTLTGIGEVRAQAIIANRPYASLEELVSKEVLSENLFNDLQAQLSL